MGSDKALLDIEGQTLVSRIIDRLGVISDDVFVVAKRALDVDARVVLEPKRPQTPLLGVLTALRAARHPLVFICGCDMPFVSPSLATLLVERANRVDAVVPFREGKSEALHCVWSATAADKVASILDRGDYGLRRALRQLNIDTVDEGTWRSIDPDGLAFTNINTPADLTTAIRLASPNEPRPASDHR